MRSAITSSCAIVAATAAPLTTSRRGLCATAPLLQGERIFQSKYKQEMFGHIEAMKTNKTYPGALRAATPGDTKHYSYGQAIKRDPRDRSYWRPVVDDLYVEDKQAFRVRFKDSVWVTTRWETRMHTIEASLPREATVADLVRELTLVNRHPHLCQSPFVILHEDRALPMTATLESLDLDEMSALYAVDAEGDHLAHLPEAQLKDPNIDEITDADIKDKDARYRDLGLHSSEGVTRGRPSWQAQPSKIFNFGRF